MEAPAPRICPDCQHPMQRFFAREVELDRCPGCGGIWFDWGELEQVTGRELAPELLRDGFTARRCAYCRITLATAVLPGGVPVELCTACGGLFLDAGELTELGGEEPEPPSPPTLPVERQARAAEVLRPFNSFACVKCGQRFPLSKGNALAGGLACPGCTPMPQPLPGGRGDRDIFFDSVLERLGARNRLWTWWK